MSTTASSSTTSTVSIDPATEVGLVSLSVADLERSLAYYTEAIGLTLLESSASEATLGVAGRPLLVLREQPGAEPWPRGGRSYTGLYHFAILLPTRTDLGLWLRNWFALGMPMPGQGDHLVSEALYLEDPDMHGIEMYRDRPRGEWQWEGGQVRMASDPVDIQGILDDAERSGRVWEGLPEGTFVGHIHLQVGDIPQAEAFYQGVLGFDIIARMPTALFISAGGYHHHIGMNIWHSAGAGPAPTDSVRLRYFTIDLATPEALAAVVGRLDAAGVAHHDHAGTVIVQDPWQNTLLLQVGHAADVRAAAALESAADSR